MKRCKKPSIAGVLRTALVAIVIALQVLLVSILTQALRSGAVYVYAAVQVIAVIDILAMVSRTRNSSYTIAWILIIMILPISGYILYILWGRLGSRGPRIRRLKAAIERGTERLEKDPEVYAGLGVEYPYHKRIGGYLGRKGFPLYRNTTIEYYPLGELQFEAMLHDIEKAERFVFLEYFILADGELWSRFESLLERKAAEGVEIRLMYDDFGSIFTVPEGFIRKLEAKGIRTQRFNPIHKYISRLYLNNRNHQKIAVIDGNIAYTGGANIADEYANIYPKHGHWKDTAIRLHGDAVWTLTVTFLAMWEGETGESVDYSRYKPEGGVAASGYVQPFYDGPLNNPDNPAEFTYRYIITNARKYVYITTPYLVIDNSMLDAIIGASESGVDVRIITPKIWDHWFVHAVTQSNYGELLKSGVRIYEYSPGYIHAKTIISDDDHAVTGSINMDYRSFNLHFENGVWICGDPVLAEIRDDIEKTIELCEEIELERYLARPWYTKAVQGVLRIFAVLL